MRNRYTVGDLVELTATFTVVGTSTTVNPTTVSIFVRKPDGSVLTPSPTNPSTGVFTVQVTLDEAGEWAWRATGTGAAQASSDPEQGAFSVKPNAF